MTPCINLVVGTESHSPRQLHHDTIHPSISLVCPASSPSHRFPFPFGFGSQKLRIFSSFQGRVLPSSLPQHPATTHYSLLSTGHCRVHRISCLVWFWPPTSRTRMSDIWNCMNEILEVGLPVPWRPIPGLSLNLQIMLTTINNAPSLLRSIRFRSAFTGGSVNTSRD